MACRVRNVQTLLWWSCRGRYARVRYRQLCRVFIKGCYAAGIYHIKASQVLKRTGVVTSLGYKSMYAYGLAILLAEVVAGVLMGRQADSFVSL